VQSAVMVAAKHGAKHVCSDCTCKYYDLGIKNAVCPKCGGQPVMESLPRGRQPATSRRASFRR
jgi:hypothetical protein